MQTWKQGLLYYIAHLLLEEIVVSIEYQCQQNTNPIIFLLCSIEGRNETFFRDWPPKPVENEDEGIVQRDPRLFPIRTPQPPRRPQLYSSQYFLDEYLGEFQVNYNFWREIQNVWVFNILSFSAILKCSFTIQNSSKWDVKEATRPTTWRIYASAPWMEAKDASKSTES